MAGGLMQLVAYGAQDVYLTGQPKVTFFQAVYKRHTNFAMENIQQTVNGTPSNSGRVSVTIARNGDLVGNMYVSLLPATANLTSNNTVFDTNWIAERALADIEMTIGGQRIDKHYQTWWRLYAELFLGESDKYSWGKMTTSSCSAANAGGAASLNGNQGRVFLPLLFFFNRNPGLYLPLIALQYHEVRLDFDLTSYYSSYFGTDFQVWANYVYLDTEERRRFAQKGHEYLIEQVQHTGGDSTTSSYDSFQLIRLSFNHPVKEFVWCYTNPNASATANLNALWNFCTGTGNVQVTCNTAVFVNSNNYILPHLTGVPHLYFAPNGAAPGLFSGLLPANSGVGVANTYSWIEECYPSSYNNASGGPGLYETGPLNQFKIILNGQDRFKEQLGKYFNQYQPYQYHSGTPYPGIYCYSFALQPEEHQPTGTCNFSRIDNAQVAVSIKAGGISGAAPTQKLFAVNYNILRIQSGMGGLAFSN
jgi:Large eukaryotic DNA virus major capsid protein/Major capsid protein N-terminus